MKRRQFLEGVFTGTAVTLSSTYLWDKLDRPDSTGDTRTSIDLAIEMNARQQSQQVQASTPVIEKTAVETVNVAAEPSVAEVNQQVAALKEPIEIAEDKQYLTKIHNFDMDHPSDIHLPAEKLHLLKQTLATLDKAQAMIGHGHFNVVGFDQMLRTYNHYSKQGPFPPKQLGLIEELFEVSAQDYGFYGEKIVSRLTAKVPEREISKIPRTGHYLYKGESQRLYKVLRRDVGDSIVLTSGVRGMVKQSHLFMAKVLQSEGNLSRASRSLAPPGHSYHAIGDFDVGKVGFGRRNFTKDFAQTDEYKRLQDLGYVAIRYTSGNRFGVRYEPWHVKVV